MKRRTRTQELAVGVIVLAGIGIAAFLAVQVGAFRLDTGTTRLFARFESAAGLTEGATVSVAGVDVGTLADMNVEEGQARLEILVDSGLAVHEDAVLRIRSRSVLGEKYLQLLPGSADAPRLEEGAEIRQTRGQVEIDEMVTAMGPILDATDPEALSRVIGSLEEALANDPERLELLVDDTAALVHNLRVASEDAPALVQELRAAVSETRATVARTRPVVERADTVLQRLDAASEPLVAASEELPATLDEVRAAVSETRAVIRQVDGSTGDLAEVLENLSEIDKWELRRLFREEGMMVRIRPQEIEPSETDAAEDEAPPTETAADAP